jgi:hypothetical protein
MTQLLDKTVKYRTILAQLLHIKLFALSLFKSLYDMHIQPLHFLLDPHIHLLIPFLDSLKLLQLHVNILEFEDRT